MTTFDNSISVSYVQKNNLYEGIADGGNFVINGITSPLLIPVNPNFSVSDGEPIKYEWRFFDVGGNLHTGTATI